MNENSIMVVRLGAMGDIIHALPAVGSLRLSFPQAHITWVVARKWGGLLEGNPNIDELILFDRGSIGELARSYHQLRAVKPNLAVDFQGLIQSALIGRMARPRRFIGLEKGQARESLAANLYSHPVKTTGPHRVERNLQLVAAAGAGRFTEEAWIPGGRAEGILPSGPFVLTNPFAGWTSKQWPIERYERLAALLREEGLTLVMNVPASRARDVEDCGLFAIHVSGLEGLIDATRQAVAVIGVDSGPLHLAAALGRPGVAIYGPTDPIQTGPFKSRIAVLRADGAQTTYKREAAIHESMKEISAESVREALKASIAVHSG